MAEETERVQKHREEKPRYEAMDALMQTVPEEMQGKVGHAVSLVMSRMAGDGQDGVCRATDSEEYLLELATIFGSIGSELRRDAAHKHNGQPLPGEVAAATAQAVTDRVLAALEAGDKINDVRVRQDDLAHDPDPTVAKRIFIGTSTDLPEDTIFCDTLPDTK